MTYEAPQAQGEQESPYGPIGHPLVFEDFDGVDTEASRPGIDDKAMYWANGFMPIGKRNLRTLPGVGPVLNTKTGVGVIWYDFANIGTTPYCIVVHADGSLHAINTNSNAVLIMGGPGTIKNPSVANQSITQWGAKYIIVVAKQTNGYWVWDGTTLYASGQTVPGVGAVPTGIQGTAIEIYQSRVWIANGPLITFSAPASFVDFATADGGGSFTSTDSFLRVGFSRLVQSNGFLYLIADSSINYISGVSTGGSPPTTTFTNQNADPEIGTVWGNTVDVFSRNIVFANSFGAHISYGGAVAKISDPLDGIYNSVPNFGGLIPSASKAIIFGKKVWMLLLPIIDPITKQQANTLLMWDGKKKWWSSLQDINLVFIQCQEINSVLTTYGTDGSKIYPLFQQASIGFVKTAQSKLWDKPGGYWETKTAVRLFGLAIYYSTLAPSLQISVDNETSASPNSINVGPLPMNWTTQNGLPMNWKTQGGQPMNWTTAGAGSGTGIVVFPPTAVAQQGALTGLTVTTSAADMALISLALVDEVWGYRG